MSKFIENSKHGAMTAAVTGHFFGSGNSEIPGKANPSGFPRFGDVQYNGKPASFPPGTGVNYLNPSQAGHKV